MKDSNVELRIDPQSSTDHPVLVNEVLSDSCNDVCVSMANDGYCWIIHKNTMTVWNHIQNSTRYPTAYSLALASTGLKYAADNVCFYQSDERDLPGVLAVSPEGVLRHFNQLDRKPFECDINMHNDIVVGVHCLNTKEGIKFLMTTSRNGFYLIEQTSQRLSSNGAVSYRELREKEKKRFSIFSSSSTDDKNDVKQSYVFFNDETVDLSEKVVATVSVNSLKISTAADTNECSQLEVTTLAAHYYELIGRKRIVTDSQRKNAKIAIGNLCGYNGGVLVYSMCHIMEDRTYYAIGFIKNIHAKELSFEWFYEIRFDSDVARKQSIALKLQDMQLSVVQSDKTSSDHSGSSDDLVMLSSQSLSLATRFPGRGEKHFEVPDSQILQLPKASLGTVNVDGICYVFLKDSGFAVLRLVPKKFDVTFDKTLMMNWIKEIALKDKKEPKNPQRIFAHAFMNFSLKKFGECDRLSKKIDSMRPSDFVDVAVNFAVMVLDGVPPSDIRWDIKMNAVDESNVAGKKSFIMMHLLENKRKFFDMFVCFLNYTGGVNKMNSTLRSFNFMPEPNRARTAMSYLVEFGEKLSILTVLYEWVSETHVRLFDTALRKVLTKGKGDLNVNQHISIYDIFFRQVSSVCNLFEALFSLEQNELKSAEEPSERFRVIVETGGIVQKVLDAISTFRCSPGAIRIDVDNRWTSMTRITSAFGLHLNHIFELLENDCKDMSDQYNLLCDHAFVVSEFILNQQNSDQLTNSPIIDKFLKLHEREKAIKLAEEFEDFATLIRETLKDENRAERLNTYKQVFASSNFSLVLMKYFLQQKMIPELLSETGSEVDDFILSSDATSWSRHSRNGAYQSASSVLRKLADKHMASTRKRKMALVLGKLNALCADSVDDEQLMDFSEDLNLIKHRDLIPFTIREKSRIRDQLLSADELIDLNILHEKTAESFSRALLVLMDFYSPNRKPNRTEHFEDMRLKIWREAVLSDDWKAFGNREQGHTSEFAQQTVLYKLLDVVRKIPIETKEKRLILPEGEQITMGIDLDEPVRYMISADVNAVIAKIRGF